MKVTSRGDSGNFVMKKRGQTGTHKLGTQVQGVSKCSASVVGFLKVADRTKKLLFN